MDYRWRENTGPKPSVAANVFGSVIEQLAGDDLLSVKPQQIVDAARKRGSPIRELFDWNDETAAEAHRCQQARRLLGLLEIVVVEVKGSRAVSSRAFFSVRNDGERGYVARSRILSDRDLRMQVIMAAKDELERYVNKYEAILALGTYIQQLQEIIDRMHADITELAAAATAPPRKGKKRGRRQQETHA